MACFQMPQNYTHSYCFAPVKGWFTHILQSYSLVLDQSYNFSAPVKQPWKIWINELQESNENCYQSYTKTKWKYCVNALIDIQ